MTHPKDRWLLRVREDLQSARVLLKEGIFSQVCFHAQQAVEKSLKAVFAHKDMEHPRTHSLRDLSDRVAELAGLSLSGFEKEIRFLDQFYVPTRYPDAPVGSLPEGTPTRPQALRALTAAESVCLLVERHLSR